MHYKIVILAAAIIYSCTPQKTPSPTVSLTEAHTSIKKSAFATLDDGRQVDRYELSNGKLTVSILTYGGIIQSIQYPDKEGVVDDLVLGHDSMEGYLTHNPYFGGVIGRYGNRIAQGRFTIDGRSYQLAQNDGQNHLHGGLIGYDKVVWDVQRTATTPQPSITLHYMSPDGEEGYPGNLDTKVTYSLTEDDGLIIDYKATTDKTTVVNLTNHSYFNLGKNKSSILEHQLVIMADRYLPVDETLIPVGEMRSVEGTPFDFSSSKTIGHDIDTDHEQLIRGGGYDHCWVVQDQPFREVALIATVYDEATGRHMEVWTTEPGVQFYTGNFLDGTIIGKNGIAYGRRSALCLETQHFPNAPNEPLFASTLLKPGDVYSSQTQYKFSNRYTQRN